MKYLIENATIVDPNSEFNGKKKSILVENGIIKKIGTIKKERGMKQIQHPNLHLSPGWFDMQASFGEPGFENKEDLISGRNAAAQGGFTGVCLMPTSHPAPDSKSKIEYFSAQQKGNFLVEVYPAACLTIGSEGKEITEQFDLIRSGAVAFSDYKNPVENSGLMLRLLQYANSSGALIIAHCEELSLSAGGLMHEGEVSTALGLKGLPSISEEINLARNISLLEYSQSRLHISSISSGESVNLIKNAKSKGVRISSGVAAHQLLLTDEELMGFDSYFKVTPPLRNRKERDALKRGVAQNVIDVITSDHCPEPAENKEVEFDQAVFGMIGLETAYAVANTALFGAVTQSQLLEKLVQNPRQILGLNIPQINEGSQANLTLFDPSLKWNFEKKHLSSRSSNTPFLGRPLIGKPLGVFNHQQYFECC